MTIAVLPCLMTMLGFLLLATFLPEISLWLPRQLGVLCWSALMARPNSGIKSFSVRTPGGRAASATRPASAEQALFGLHAVEAALSNPKRIILHAYLTDNAAAKLAPLITARRVPVTALLPPDLDGLVGGGAVHQGAVLHVEPLEQPSLEEFLEGLPEEGPAAIAMLDQVTDPHNVGAVLRSAAAFGVAALIVQERHSPPLSGTLAKAASGALDHVPVVSVVNLSRALERLQEHGFQCSA